MRLLLLGFLFMMGLAVLPQTASGVATHISLAGTTAGTCDDGGDPDPGPGE